MNSKISQKWEAEACDDDSGESAKLFIEMVKKDADCSQENYFSLDRPAAIKNRKFAAN